MLPFNEQSFSAIIIRRNVQESIQRIGETSVFSQMSRKTILRGRGWGKPRADKATNNKTIQEEFAPHKIEIIIRLCLTSDKYCN